MLIVMTEEQADSVRGLTSDDSGLDPIALADGVTFILPLAVLTDPKQASKLSLLQSFTQRDVAANEFAVSSD